MLLEKERKKIIEYSKKMLSAGLTQGTSGNISIFNRQESLIAITPSGVDYSLLRPQDISILSPSGSLVEGQKASSEWDMHSRIYKSRDDINSIIHCHPTFSTTLACLRKDLPAVDYMIAVAGGKDVRVADYATFGTPELAENCLRAMENRKAVLLANHGLTCGGSDLSQSWNITLQIEYCAELYVRSSAIGEPVILSDQEMERVLERFKTYGPAK